jgi:hypothetical protein
MRYFKSKKPDAHVAQALLQWLEAEEEMKIKGRATEKGVSMGVLQQYFGDASMRKVYPPKLLEAVMDKLVAAGLVEEFLQVKQL